MMNGMGTFGFGGMGFGWIFPMIFIGVIIWGVITLSNNYKNSNHYHSLPVGDDAFDILKKRYAKGEITKDQFEQMKKDLKYS